MMEAALMFTCKDIEPRARVKVNILEGVAYVRGISRIIACILLGVTESC